MIWKFLLVGFAVIGSEGIDMAQCNKLGMSCGTWERILGTHNRGPKGRRPNTELRGFYDAMCGRGIMERDKDFVYRLTEQGQRMAEWCLAILPQHQVKIRWKKILR